MRFLWYQKWGKPGRKLEKLKTLGARGVGKVQYLWHKVICLSVVIYQIDIKVQYCLLFLEVWYHERMARDGCLSFHHVAFHHLVEKIWLKNRSVFVHLVCSVGPWPILEMTWLVGLFVWPPCRSYQFSHQYWYYWPHTTGRQMASLTLLISHNQGSLLTIASFYVMSSLQMPRPVLPIFSDSQPS